MSQFFYNWKRLRRRGFSGIIGDKICLLYTSKYAGEDGISAYGVLMYVSMVFQAIFVGYSVGVAPIESYHLGAENRRELRGLLRRSLGLLAACAACMFAAGQVLAAPLSRLYVGYDPGLFEMTSHAFGIFSFSFLFSGFAIYGSSFFTALNLSLIHISRSGGADHRRVHPV